MIESNVQRRRGRRRAVGPSSSLRGHFIALARQVRQWTEARGHVSPQRGSAIGITSLDLGAGTSTVSFNLACALAALEHSKTLLVEADFGRPSISRRLGHNKATGLAELLLGTTTIDEAVFATPIADVFVLGGGQTDERQALELPFEVLTPLFNETLQDFSFSVFDLPVASNLTTCHSMIPYLDGVILNVESHSIDQRRIARFKKQLETCGVDVIGIVLNKS